MYEREPKEMPTVLFVVGFALEATFIIATLLVCVASLRYLFRLLFL